MEFAVALFGAVASAAVAKLVRVMENFSSETLEMWRNASIIKNELSLIDSLIKQSYTHTGMPVHASLLQTSCIEQLRCLAYDIEDCIDSFDANKLTPEQFATQLGDLKVRSEDTKEQIGRYLVLAQGLVGTQQWADAGAAVVPRELQDLLDDPTHQVWLVKNLGCLLYLCLFPPNHDISTVPLMRRWMAEGLVHREDVAADNLEILLTASIIKPTQRSNNGDVEICRPTSEMLQCVAERSRFQNFILVCDSTLQLHEGEALARRLSVHCSAHALNLPENLSYRRLRTLAVFAAAAGGAPGAVASDEAVLDFSRYKVLRVLDLKERGPLSNKHLDDIIIHHPQLLMKYLSINLGSIDRIGRLIGRLNQLETLDLSGSQIVTVFKEVLLLPKLKHLFGKFQLSRSDIPSVPVLGLFESSLERFLREESVLETLDGFVIGKRYGFAQLMSLMRMLRKVKIWCSSKPKASRKNLGVISRAITKFILDGTDEPHRGRSLSIDYAECKTEFVSGIVPVAGNLYSLKLRGELSQFPPFVAGLRDIEELCLCSTGLSWELIRDGLSNVKTLKCLKLIENDLGRIYIEVAHLKSIQRICIVSNTTIDIVIQADALPYLVSLHILCENLNVIPGPPGIEITHMKELEEIALHPRVAGGIKTLWQQAASGHPYKPVRVIEGPP